MPKQKFLAAFVLTMTLGSPTARANDLEVLHWWTSGSEAEALGELKKMLKNKSDYQWKDFSVVGGGGQNALKVLKSRVLAGKTPAAVQLKAPAIQEWGKYLTTMDSVAGTENWKAIIPASVAGMMQVKGHWTAVPVNVHRVNWVWLNAGLFKKLGGPLPQTIEELFAMAERAKKAGIKPFAHGGEPWQDITAFEEILLASQGPEFYQQFAQLKPEALQSEKLQSTFDWMRRYSELLPADRKGMTWDKASKEVIEGRALMQFMGDWAKGEITIAGKIPGKDILCLAAPGSTNAFIYNVDSFAFFDTQSDVTKKGQLKLASLILSREFQELFNKKKGSIPARIDLDLKNFDSCAQSSMDTFRKGTLVPSIAHHMALPPAQVTAIQDLVSEHLNSQMSSEEAVRKLKAAIDASR